MHPKRLKAPGAVASLVLGILGIVVCGLLAPFAWYYGVQGERAAREGDFDGEGMATAGKILGIVGTVLLVAAIVILLTLLGVGVVAADDITFE